MCLFPHANALYSKEENDQLHYYIFTYHSGNSENLAKWMNLGNNNLTFE